MDEFECQNKAQTVLGLIEPDTLGITLPHEHLLLNVAIWFMEPTRATERALAYQPVSLENLGWIRYHPMSNLDDLRMDNEQLAIREALRYRYAGGSTLVELSNIGLGRDPLALARISRATGLNIIMGTGYYVAQAKEESATLALTEEVMAEEIIRDIEVGVGNTSIHAGIIGEVGVSWPIRENERRSLHATGLAQKATGAPVNIHPGRSPDCPFKALEILDDAGADISRVVISHIDRTIFMHETRVRLAKTGCYLEYDLFGTEGWYPMRMVMSEDNPIKADLPNDAGRINEIMALIEEGFLHQILISQDTCKKHMLYEYGGPGYSHILDNVVPLMREKGLTDEQLWAFLVENPKRLFHFV